MTTRARYALLALAVAAAAVLSPALLADERAERARKAAAALAGAVEAGNALFHDPLLGTKERSCAKCHEDPEKPKLALPDRVRDYPKFDRGAGRVVTLGQKINLMIEKNLKGTPLTLGSERIVALEAYLRSK